MSYKREREGRVDHEANELGNASHLATGKRTLVEAELGAIQRKPQGPGGDASAQAPQSSGADPWAGLDAIQYQPGGTAEAFRDVVEGMRAADVQRRGGGDERAEDVHRAAAHGIAGASGSLPFLDQIQRSFGAHDISNVKAHTDGAAAAGAKAMGAEAYATGDHVAFAGAPSLHTAAHEAAHIVQQRAGVHLKGGVGAVGDTYEQHADAVADRVVQGKSAEDLLDAFAPRSANSSTAVQRKENAEQGAKADAPARAGSPAGSGSAADLVTMKWIVDYTDTVGTQVGSHHDRSGEHQMIVNQLKIYPHGAAEPQKLEGGNMAQSGAVRLGQVTVPKGSGDVTAAVQYTNKSDFKVDLKITPIPKGSEGRKLVEKAKKQASASVRKQLEARGDYLTLAKEVEADIAPLFDDATVTVVITPTRKALKTWTADGASYTVDENSVWKAVIEPTATSTDGVNWSESDGEKKTSGDSEEDGSKTSVSTETSSKVTDAKKFIEAFKSSISTNVQQMVKNIQDAVLAKESSSSSVHTDATTWKVGIEPKKEEKDDDKAKGKDDKSSSDGISGKIKKGIESGIKSGIKWLLRKGKGAIKKIVLADAALDIASDLWDTVTGRVSITRESGDETTTTKGSTSKLEAKGTREIDDMSSIATELTREFTTEKATEIETAVSAKFGVELSKTKKKDSSSERTTMKTASGTTKSTTTGQPKVSIKRVK